MISLIISISIVNVIRIIQKLLLFNIKDFSKNRKIYTSFYSYHYHFVLFSSAACVSMIIFITHLNFTFTIIAIINIIISNVDIS